MQNDELKVPEAKTVGGNPKAGAWAAAFAKLAQKGGPVSNSGDQVQTSIQNSTGAEYNPGGVSLIGKKAMTAMQDATIAIAAKIAGYDVPAQSTKVPNDVEKVEKIPTTAFDAIDRMAQQIDSELFTDEQVTADEMVKSLVNDLQGVYEEFDKLALGDVKQVFQEHRYELAGCVKYRLQDDILTQIDKLVKRLDSIDFSGSESGITRDDIQKRIDTLQEYVEAVLDGVINKDAEFRQQQELNRITSGETTDVACDAEDKVATVAIV